MERVVSMALTEDKIGAGDSSSAWLSVSRGIWRTVREVHGALEGGGLCRHLAKRKIRGIMALKRRRGVAEGRPAHSPSTVLCSGAAVLSRLSTAEGQGSTGELAAARVDSLDL